MDFGAPIQYYFSKDKYERFPIDTVLLKVGYFSLRANTSRSCYQIGLLNLGPKLKFSEILLKILTQKDATTLREQYQQELKASLQKADYTNIKAILNQCLKEVVVYDKFHFEDLHFYFLLKEMLRVILKEDLIDYEETAELNSWDKAYKEALRSIYVVSGDLFYRIIFKAVSRQEDIDQGLDLLKKELKNDPCKISFKSKSLVNLACVMVNLGTGELKQEPSVEVVKLEEIL